MHHAIAVTDLRKRYRVYFEKPALIKNILPFLVSQGKAQEFWALNGVSFTVGKGECVGIIGPNGSGKSTILSVLAGVTAPTDGTLSINGRVSSLLSLGAGFNFELTGQENVYLNGAILGFSKSQIDGIYKDIVEFADLGKFMNAKLATYSSGMNMRLGFAIAIMVSFDVLIIDEILAVGDLSFQTKCFRAMKRFYEDEGKTIILVSHDLGKIAELCSRVIWFEHGRIQAEGEPSEVLKEYREKYREKYEPLIVRRRSARAGGKIRPAHLRVDASKTLRRIPPLLFGSNLNYYSEGKYFWDEKRNRLQPSAIRQCEPLHFRSLRFPAWLHADFYHWQEAIGAQRKAQTGPGGESFIPTFGTDEFIALCGRLGVEPLLTANVVSGSAAEAAEWVRYCRSRGLAVRHVEVGHEPYFDDFHPLGTAIRLTPEEYAARFVEFAQALRGVDPDIKLIGCGCMDTGQFTRYRYPDWNERVLRLAGRSMDFMSIHNTDAPILNITRDHDTPPPDVTYEALLAAPLWVEDNLARVGAQLDRLSPATRLAITQYGTYFTDVPAVVHGRHKVKDREAAGDNWNKNRTLAAALYEAMLLNLFMRSPRVEMAHRFNIQDPIHSALIVSTPDGVVLNPQYYIHRVYNRCAGMLRVESSVDVAGYSHEAVGIITAHDRVPYVDQVALIDESRETMLLLMINRSLTRAVRVKISIGGFDWKSAKILRISAHEYDTVNELPGREQIHFGQIGMDRGEIVHPATGRAHVELPEHSLTALILYRQQRL